MTEDGATGKSGGKARRKPGGGQAGEVARRGGGFRRASDRARPTFEKVAGRHGFAQADVLLRWAEIAGEALAPTCRPVKVRYGSNRQLGATLVVSADGARAPEVEHRKTHIIERVNQFYGYRAISRVQIVQTGAAGFRRAGGRLRRAGAGAIERRDRACVGAGAGRRG